MSLLGMEGGAMTQEFQGQAPAVNGRMAWERNLTLLDVNIYMSDMISLAQVTSDTHAASKFHNWIIPMKKNCIQT